MLSREWRYCWSSADRRCSNDIWVIDNFIAYQGASYIRDLTVPLSYKHHQAVSLETRHNERDGIWNHRCLNRLFRYRSKKTSQLPVTGLCEGNSPVTGEFPPKRASNVENDSIWRRHRALSNVVARINAVSVMVRIFPDGSLDNHLILVYAPCRKADKQLAELVLIQLIKE